MNFTTYPRPIKWRVDSIPQSAAYSTEILNSEHKVVFSKPAFKLPAIGFFITVIGVAGVLKGVGSRKYSVDQRIAESLHI